MKKLGFGLFVLLLILGSVLYFTKPIKQTKSTTLQPLKHAVNLWVKQMQENGFEIVDRVQSGEDDHFIFTFKHPDQIALYLQQKGLHTKAKEILPFEGLQINADILYHSGTISIALHPLNVPKYFRTSSLTQSQLAKLEQMIKQHVFSAHIDINYDQETFTGKLEDINTSLEDKPQIQIEVKKVHFGGTYQKGVIIEHHESSQIFHVDIDSLFSRNIQEFTNHYNRTGKSEYDYTTTYSASNITTSEGIQGELEAQNVDFSTISSLTHEIKTESVEGTIANVAIHSKQNKLTIQEFKLAMRSSKPINRLNQDASEELTAEDTHIDISNLSVDGVEIAGSALPGFVLHANLDVAPSLSIHTLIEQPKKSSEKIDGMIHLSIEKPLLEYLKKDPERILFYMMYRPKREAEQRIYDIDVDHGSLTINGKPVEF